MDIQNIANLVEFSRLVYFILWSLFLICLCLIAIKFLFGRNIKIFWRKNMSFPMQLFDYDQVHFKIRDISASFKGLSEMMDINIKDSDHKRVAMEKLLDTRDAFIRAKLLDE